MMLGAGADPRTSYLRQLFISLAILGCKNGIIALRVRS